MNKKRFIAIFFIAVVLMSLTACASEDVKSVSSKIRDLGTITIDSKEKLMVIEKEYALLSDEDKQKVKNYDQFIEANKEYEKIVCLSDIQSTFLQICEAACLEYKSYSEFEKNIVDTVEGALTILKKYNKTEFADKNFKEELNKYIKAMDSQKKSISYLYSDTDKYISLYYDNGLVKCANCIGTFKETYGLSLDEKTESFMTKITSEDVYIVIPLEKNIEVSTENGDYEITIFGAAETDWDKTGYEDDLKDDNETTYPASIRVLISNKSYSGIYEKEVCGYDLYQDNSLVVKDSNGYKLDYYDIAGPGDGVYKTSSQTAIGQKEKASYPFVIHNDEDNITIEIGDKYKVFIAVDRENVVSVFTN